jgi:hypothetical protein
MKNIHLRKIINIPIYNAKLTIVVADNIKKVNVNLNGTTVGLKDYGDFGAVTLSDCGNHFGLVFKKNYTRIGAISHEIFHLVHRILDYYGANFDAEHHEQGALLTEYLTEIVVNELSKIK